MEFGYATQTSPRLPAASTDQSTGLKGRTTGTKFVLWKRSKPPLLVPTQIFPSRSSRMVLTSSLLSPSLELNDSISVPNCLTLLFSSSGDGERRSPSPRLVIQSAPSLANRIATEPTWTSVSSGGCRLSNGGMGRTDLVV